MNRKAKLEKASVNFKFAERTKELRNNFELSQEKLAEHTGLSRATIMHIEGGRQRVFLDQAVKIASAFDIPVHWMLL